MQTCRVSPASAQTRLMYHPKSMPFQTSRDLERTKERRNFNTVQGQQLANKRSEGENCNTFQICPTSLLIAAFVVRRRISFLFKQRGHTNVSHTLLSFQTFCPPVAHQTIELFKPSANLSSLLPLPSQSTLFH